MSVGHPWFDSTTSLRSLNEHALISQAAYRARGDDERRGLAEREPNSTGEVGRAVEFNPAAEAMFGITRAQAAGRSAS